MPWLQLSLTAEKDLAPAVQTLFENLGALSVSYGDAEKEQFLESAPDETRLWSHTRITALFDIAVDPNLLQAAVSNAISREAFHNLEFQTLEDRVWERTWLNDFHPMRFGRRLWICPAGRRPDKANAVIVDLDPGLAFGTGTHPTTALCLRWLDGIALTGKRVLDYGCGSGILAIAAALLGADSVAAVDCDTQALEATRDNAAKNAVQDRIVTLLPEQAPQEAFDVVLANILAGTLIELAPQLRTRVSTDGLLALSGILVEQAKSVASKYGEWADLNPPMISEEWVLLHGSKREVQHPC
jgi:ribosomal protein L11 methyltransferase